MDLDLFALRALAHRPLSELAQLGLGPGDPAYAESLPEAVAEGPSGQDTSAGRSER